MSSKVSDLAAILGINVVSTDLLYLVDLSAASSGSKKVTIAEFIAALEVLWGPIPVTSSTALTDAVATVIGQVATASYDGFKALVILTDGTNKEMWTIDAIIETSTVDIVPYGGPGDNARGHEFDAVINGANAELRCTANGSGWTAKTVLIKVPS
jgi:hypothetical protein